MNNVFYSLGASISSKLVILLINIVSFRNLEPKEYGTVALLLVMAATIGSVSGMGASVAVNTIVARNGSNSLSALFIKYNYLISFFTSLIMAIGVHLIYFDSLEGVEPWQAFIFIFLFSYFSSLNSISEAVLMGFHSFKRRFINNISVFFVSVPMFFYLIIQFDYIGVLIALIIYRALLSLVNLKSVSKTRIFLNKKVDRGNHKEIISIFKRLSLPVIASGLMVAPIIGLTFKIITHQDNGLQKLAYFSIVYQIYLVAVFIPNALNGYFISQFSNKKTQDFKKIALYNFLFSLIIVVLLILFQDLVFWVVDDNNVYIKNNYYIMLATIIFFSINAVFASFWPSVGKAWFGLVMNVLWALTLIAITFVLSERQIAEALSWAFLCSYLILTVIQALGYRKVTHEKY